MTVRVQLNRRRFLASSVATSLLTSSVRAGETRPTTVAAIQMRCHVGDMDANLQSAENWIRHAIRRGAKWIVLPEFFVSGMSYQPEKMLDAVQLLNGEATQLLQRLSKQGNAYIGGTFLVQFGKDVFNTFMLATPDGKIFTHDKDFPSGFAEHSFYAGGEDGEFVAQLKRNGIETLDTPIASRQENTKSGVFQISQELSIGVAACWEQIRYRTARRLRNKVDLVLAASAWGILDPDVGVAEVERGDLVRWAKEATALLHRTPGELAKLVGAPVVHANTVGSGWSKDGRVGRPPMLGRGMGDSQIVGASGNIIASRPASEGEGVVIADVNLGRVKTNRPIPPEAFWLPEVTNVFRESWLSGGASGREYYLQTARPHRNKR